MASNSQDPTVKMPPLGNWQAQTFAYGFLLDRSATLDYSGNAAPNQSGRTGFDKPQPDDLHLLNLNPQSLSMSEPLATSTVPSQGGGIFTESRGGVLKTLTIRGTTGLLPPVAPYAQQMKGPQITDTVQQTALDAAMSQMQNATGFFEFYRLRRLFRQFMLERKQGKSVQMHWLDFKGDEFWIVEPVTFDLERGRFTYTYDIRLTLTQPSQLKLSHKNQGQDSKIRGLDSRDYGAAMLQNPINGALDPSQLSALSRMVQMANGASAFINNFALGVVNTKLQSVLSAIGDVQQFFSDISAVRRASTDAALNLYKQTYSAIQGLSDSWDSVTPEAFKKDINEWQIEMQMVTEGLMSNHLLTFGSSPGQQFQTENAKYTTPLAVGGTKTAFLTETTNSNQVTQVSSGLALIGNVEQMMSTTAMRAEDILTGESIFDVAQRVLGDAQRFIDLVILNQLKPPFIIADPANKTPGVLAWTDKILVPASEESASLSSAAPVQASVPSFSSTVSLVPVAPLSPLTQFYVTTPQYPYRDNMWLGFTVTWTSGLNVGQTRVITCNTDQLNGTTLFTLNRALPNAVQLNDAFAVALIYFTSQPLVTPDDAAFGMDVMGIFSKSNGVLTDGTTDIMVGPLKDLVTIRGFANFQQAVTLALQTPRGANKSNPLYGTTPVVGRPLEPNILALNVFYTRQSLLQDPRISSVEQPQLVLDSGSLFFTVYIRPVRVQRTLFLRIPV